MGDRHRQYILVVMTSNVLKRFQHSGHFLHSVIVAETKPGAMKEKCKIRWKIFVISNTEPDKDSLLKLCMFGKVEGIEMASATSYSPVIQKNGVDLFMFCTLQCAMEIEVQTAVDVNICLYGGLKWTIGSQEV